MRKKRITTFRIAILAVWIVLAIALLLLVQYADIHSALQKSATILVWVYLFCSFLMAGILAWLKRKYS